jgi:UDP-N-acetylglucosamine 2-epimerase
MEGEDFLRLLINSKGIIGNSSVGIRECAYLGVPAINIGTRQNRRERGQNVVDVEYNQNQIKEVMRGIITNPKPNKSQIYGGGNSGEIIAQFLHELPLQFHKTIQY